MVLINTLSAYRDENGNRIIYSGRDVPGVRIEFLGSGNTLEVADKVRIGKLNITFDCDNGTMRMAACRFGSFSAFVRVGQDSLVSLGEDVTTTNSCVISAVEGTSVVIGNDVMLASENELRADDGHAIFDVATGGRVNWSKDIVVGNHVWLAKRAVLLGGAEIGDGSVVGFASLVTGRIPNNAVAAGSPARVIRRDIAWERPHLSRARPFYKPDAGTVTRSAYWHPTEEAAAAERGHVAVYDSPDGPAAVSFASAAKARAWAHEHCPQARIIPLVAAAQAGALQAAPAGADSGRG